MKLYDSVTRGIFLSRVNRFIAEVSVNGQTERVHVKNTGRLKELLKEGAEVWLAAGSNPARKTAWDLVAAYKDGLLFNADSYAPNLTAGEWLKQRFDEVIPERFFGDSRFDFAVKRGETNGFAEVKGVTLLENGRALFPDAPTSRGKKHLEGLISAKKQGYFAAVLFMIQCDAPCVFCPNEKTDPAFAAALREAQAAGVEIIALNCLVTPDSMTVKERIPVCLDW